MIKPPFNNEIKLVLKYKSKELIDKYNSQLKIDVSNYFNENKDFGLYECLESGYKFFYPYNIAGDNVFYEILQKFDWYYIPWKWEHKIALKNMTQKDKILEVGSGGNGFVHRLNDAGFDITGLELNDSVVKEAQLKNLKVFNETIEDHSINNDQKYDCVCSFQVLEHISDIESFISSMIKVLKKNGKLIISVPNNDSFIKYTQGGILNFPPHHMGWWSKKPLLYLKNIYDLSLHNMYYEPLQTYHINWYLDTIINRWFPNKTLKRKIFNKLRLRGLLRGIVKTLRHFIKGHSITIVYKKQ